MAKLVFIVSAYSPLFVIFALRLHHGWAFGCYIAAIVSAASLYVLLFMARHSAPQEIKVQDVSPRDDDVSAYMATYLLPFVTVSSIKPADGLAFGLYALVFLVVALKGTFTAVNPLTYLVGLRLFSITTSGGHSLLLLSKSVGQGAVIEYHDIVGGGLALEKREIGN